MKNAAVLFSAIVLVGGIVGSASAADRAVSIPASTLSSMGLAGVHPISDSAGERVRGMGTDIKSFGAAYVTAGPNNNAFNTFVASSSHAHGYTAGGAFSFYGLITANGFSGLSAGGASSSSR